MSGQRASWNLLASSTHFKCNGASHPFLYWSFSLLRHRNNVSWDAWHVTLTVALCADIPCDEVLSPTSKSSRSDSRTSFGSIFDSPMKDKSMERVSAGVLAWLLGSIIHSWSGCWWKLSQYSEMVSILLLLESASTIKNLLNEQGSSPTIVKIFAKFRWQL